MIWRYRIGYHDGAKWQYIWVSENEKDAVVAKLIEVTDRISIKKMRGVKL